MTRAALGIVAALAASALLAPRVLAGRRSRARGRRARCRIHGCSRCSTPSTTGEELTEFVTEVSRLSHGALQHPRDSRRPRRPPDYEAATIRDHAAKAAPTSRMQPTRAWDEFGARRLPALARPVPDRHLPAPGARAHGRSRRNDARGAAAVEAGGHRHPPRTDQATARQPPTRSPRPSDFRGQTIGTQQSRVADATLRALGAQPQRLPAGVTTMAGLDGVEHRVAAIENSPRLDAPGLASHDERQPLAAAPGAVRQRSAPTAR